MTTTTAARTSANTATTWQIDPNRSRVTFTARKRMFLIVRLMVQGRFAEVNGTITLDAIVPANSSVTAAIQAASIDTGKRMRDKHVRGEPFFDVEQFPTISFESVAVTQLDAAAGEYRIAGDLTIRGVTRRVVLDTHITPDQHPRLPRLQFTATTRLNRRDFGLNFNSPVLRIGDEISITLEIDAVRQ